MPKKFDFDKNRAMIEEYADICCALDNYVEKWEEYAELDERLLRDGSEYVHMSSIESHRKKAERVRKTAEKYRKKLAHHHAEEKEYFAGNRRNY